MGLKNIKTRFNTLPGIEHGSALNKNEETKLPEPIKPIKMPDIKPFKDDKPANPRMGGQRTVKPKITKPIMPTMGKNR